MTVSNFEKATVVAQNDATTTYRVKVARGHVKLQIANELVHQLDSSSRLKRMLATLVRRRARDISDETIKITPRNVRLYE